jgi:probable addiction module antidote protein
MAKTETIPWDSADYLKTEEDIANYLEAVFEDGDPALITHALRDIARVKGMWQIAEAAGLGRESVYKAFALEGKRALRPSSKCCTRSASSSRWRCNSNGNPANSYR